MQGPNFATLGKPLACPRMQILGDTRHGQCDQERNATLQQSWQSRSLPRPSLQLSGVRLQVQGRAWAWNSQILTGQVGYGPRCHRTTLGRAWKCRRVPARCRIDVLVCQVSNRTAINFLNIIIYRRCVITDDWLVLCTNLNSVFTAFVLRRPKDSAINV